MASVKGKAPSVDFNEFFKDFDPEFASLLKKSSNGKSFQKLSSKDRDKFWTLLIGILQKNSDDKNVDFNKILIHSFDLILFLISKTECELENNTELINLLQHINSSFSSVKDNGTRNKLSLVNEYWMTKMSTEEIIPGMEHFTLKYLMEICSDRPLVCDLQRLNAIRKFITVAPFEVNVPSLRPILIKLVQNQSVVYSEFGQRFVAHTMILSQKLMLDIHKTILLELNSCIKKKASCYGKIYVTAWQNANGDLRSALQKNCYQHFMEAFLKSQRSSLELTKIGHNLMSVLEVWHSERKKKNSEFITMITDSYQPFIWKYFESGFNVHRCNAADLLFKAFPLHRPGDNVLDAERLFNQQVDAMLVALKDDCHIVRIIAIREVCNILSHYWNSFTPTQIQKLLTIISREDAHDASCADVRRMVYVGFQSFLNNPLAFEYLRQILPSMADNIHDVNQKVRAAFIQLLIAIKEKGDPSLKFSDFVPTFSLYYRLAEESIKVGQLIVKLLLSNYYQVDMPMMEWTKRFIFMIKTYPKSYRNFFLYSGKLLPFSDALTIMCDILMQIGLYVVSKSSAENVDIENEDAEGNSKKMKLSKKKKPLGTANGENRVVTGKEPSKAKECAFDDPTVVGGLFDIVTILLILHDSALNKPENKEKRIKFYDTYIKFAQPFINYYKETELFNSILSLSGNIPSSLLRSNSITLPGYCMRILKSNEIDSMTVRNDNILSMLIALIKWGKGGDVLEQISLWLDAAFETQNLNATILPRRRVKITETIQPNSILGVRILDTLMKTEFVKLSILKKNYVQLFELWKFMSRIKLLIETRIEQREPYESELVSDEFLKACFMRYIKLIPLLKSSGQDGERSHDEEVTDDSLTVNHQKEIENLMQWAEDILRPLLDEKPEDIDREDIELITTIYCGILYVADNLILLHAVDRCFYHKISSLVLQLLKTRHGYRFVKSASRVATAISHSGKLLFKVNDVLKIFSKMVPCILSQILEMLTYENFSETELVILHESLSDLKMHFGKILETYQENFKSKPSSRETVRQLQTLTGIFVDVIITTLSREILFDGSDLPIYSNLTQLPLIVNTLTSLFINKKVWGPLFLLLLNSSLNTRARDSKYLLASALILDFFAVNDKKVNKNELMKALNSISDKLNKIKNNLDTSNCVVSVSETEMGHSSVQDEHSSKVYSDIDGNTGNTIPGSLIDQGLALITKIQSSLVEPQR